MLHDLTRGARDVVDWFQFRKDMRRLGVEVLSVMDKLGDLDDPGNFLMELLTVGIGQHHVLTSRHKSMDKIDMLAREGKFCGGYAPLGYDIVNREYVVNPLEADAVRLAFAMYAAGESYNAILDALPPGMCSKRGKPLGKNSLYEILNNERYIGRFFWNTRKQKNLSEAIQNGMHDIGFLHDSARELETKHRFLEEKLAALGPKKGITREYLIQELSKDIAALQENPAYIKDLVNKYIVEIVVYDDAIEIYSTADITMRMVIPENWTIAYKKAVGDTDGLVPNLNGNGCGGAQHSLPAILFHYIHHILTPVLSFVVWPIVAWAGYGV